jgi:hypothetical protein
MLIIRNEQMDVFRKEAIERFEDRMATHLLATFPTHYQSITNAAFRASFAQASKRVSGMR